MSDRRYQIYISGDLVHSLALIAQSRPPSEEKRFSTVEDVAEEMLRMSITTKYPQLAELGKTVAKLEKEVIQTLK
jgi:hypothetical protein